MLQDPAERDLAVIYPDRKAAFGIRADPGLKTDFGAVTTVIRKGNQNTLAALQAVWIFIQGCLPSKG